MKALAPFALVLLPLLGMCDVPDPQPAPADTLPVSGLPPVSTVLRVVSPDEGRQRPAPTTSTVAVAPPPTMPVPGVAGTTVQGRCTQYEPMLLELAPPGGWDIAKMSRTMWRESRCEPWALNKRTNDAGLLQVNPINYTFLRGKLGEWVDKWTLQDPRQNIRASALLCTFWRNAGKSCYQPWSGGA